MNARDKPASIASSSSRLSTEAPQAPRQAFEAGSRSQRSISPVVPPHQNSCDQAICFFFHQYVISANEGDNPGFLDFLPELYESSSPEDALAKSVKAISYIAFSGKSSVKVLFARGHEHYRAALKRITQMLESPEDAMQDSIIVAILLVVLFENLTREKPAIMMSHAKGLHTLLLHRGLEQFSSAHGWAIFRHVNAHTQIRNIELSEHPSPELLHWLQGFDLSNPAAGAISEKYRIAQVRARAAAVLSLPPATENIETRLFTVVEDAQYLDAEILEWSENLQVSCRSQTWKLDSNGLAPKAATFPTPLHQSWVDSPNHIDSTTQHILTYANVWVASLWHGHRTSRLMLSETIVELSRRLRIRPPLQSAIAAIKQMCAETCASIPFSLGDLRVSVDEMGSEYLKMNIDSRMNQGAGAGAYFAVWSLRHVVSCEFASESQVNEASEALVRIGAQFGIKQAFTLARRAYICHPNVVGGSVE